MVKYHSRVYLGTLCISSLARRGSGLDQGNHGLSPGSCLPGKLSLSVSWSLSVFDPDIDSVYCVCNYPGFNLRHVLTKDNRGIRVDLDKNHELQCGVWALKEKEMETKE